jgi:hypothetical protein
MIVSALANVRLLYTALAAPLPAPALYKPIETLRFLFKFFTFKHLEDSVPRWAHDDSTAIYPTQGWII